MGCAGATLWKPGPWGRGASRGFQQQWSHLRASESRLSSRGHLHPAQGAQVGGPQDTQGSAQRLTPRPSSSSRVVAQVSGRRRSSASPRSSPGKPLGLCGEKQSLFWHVAPRPCWT